MKKANFHTLQHLPVPESWIENALSIPGTEEKPASLPLWRKPRFIATAASLVLASALGIALFLSMGTKPPVAVKPSSTEIVWTTDASGETVATEIVVVPAENTQPTEKKSPIAQFFERIFGPSATESPTGSTAPTIKPGAVQNEKTSPTASIHPTAVPDPTESVRPTTAPKPTEPISQPETEEDTECPTEEGGVIINGPEGWSSTEPPTETPWVLPSEPTSEDPPQPTAPKPTQSLYKASVSVSVSAFAVSKINQDGGTVYCRIYDDDGVEYGDSDRYSDQHLAALTLTNINRILSYSPRDHGILHGDGRYRYEFYTRAGRSIASGSAYLSAS